MRHIRNKSMKLKVMLVMAVTVMSMGGIAHAGNARAIGITSFMELLVTPTRPVYTDSTSKDEEGQAQVTYTAGLPAKLSESMTLLYAAVYSGSVQLSSTSSIRCLGTYQLTYKDSIPEKDTLCKLRMIVDKYVRVTHVEVTGTFVP